MGMPRTKRFILGIPEEAHVRAVIPKNTTVAKLSITLLDSMLSLPEKVSLNHSGGRDTNDRLLLLN
jgi:hypothetical protein